MRIRSKIVYTRLRGVNGRGGLLQAICKGVPLKCKGIPEASRGAYEHPNRRNF